MTGPSAPGRRGRPVRIAVVACGNAGRGDDALGPAFAARAEALPEPPGTATTFAADTQLGPEHAADVAAADLALFVDAARGLRTPCALAAVAPAPSLAYSTHGFAPEAVLHACALAFGRCPPAYTLALRARRFGLGLALSRRACADLDAALALFEALRAAPDAAAWTRACAAAAPRGAAARPRAIIAG